MVYVVIACLSAEFGLPERYYCFNQFLPVEWLGFASHKVLQGMPDQLSHINEPCLYTFV